MPLGIYDHRNTKTLIYTRERNKKIANAQRGRKQSTEHIKKRFENRGDYRSDKHWNWKGETVSYSGVHKWLVRHLGKAKACEIKDDTCSSKFEWSNISGQYYREFGDWWQLCGSHHRRFDRGRV